MNSRKQKFVKAAVSLMIYPVAIFLLVASKVDAATYYVSQKGGGSTNSAAWFNSAVFSPGDTIHLCGTITNPLSVNSSGSAGRPITILFDPGAKVSNPAFTSSGLNLKGNRYLIIDGGTNGIIENTDNGTILGHHEDSVGIEASYCSNLEIRNLTIQNMYVHLYDSTHTDDTSAGPNGIQLRDGNNVFIHDCTLHDMRWAIAHVFSSTMSTNLVISNCNIYNVDHGIAIGGWSSASTAVRDIRLLNNYIHDYASWDTASYEYHHDGIHVYTASSGATVSNLVIAGNRFGGDMGFSVTAHVYLEPCLSDTSIDALIYNNVFYDATRTGPTMWLGKLGNLGCRVLNNTILTSGIGAYLSKGTYIIKNNIISGAVDAYLYYGTPLPVASYDYNLYSISRVFYTGGGITTLSAWRTYLGGSNEAHSILSTSTKINADGTLKVGSPAIDTGANLSSFFSTDFAGRSRPQGSAWDIGAFEYPSGGAASITVTPASQDFGFIDMGTTTDRTFMVQNTGTGTVSGAASVSPPFSVISGSAYTLGAAQSQVVTVRYSPTIEGTNSQMVTFTGVSGVTARVTGWAQFVPSPPQDLRLVP